MERKQTLNQQIVNADMERLYLNYFNNYLLKEGLLTPEEHRKMQMRIVQTHRSNQPRQK